jgi:hypothetical protein
MRAVARKVHAVAQTYTRGLEGFRSASDVDELRSWFERNVSGGSGFGFNGDVLRARIIADLYRICGCTAFVETGTFRGTTTILAARLFGGRIWSCELDFRSWLIAWVRCLPYRKINIARQDSRRFLRGMTSRLARDEVPMFYLDAHWNEDLPLREELDLILATWPRCIVVIDDFEVPGQPGFKFDVYGDAKLSLDLLRQGGMPDSGAVAYFPAYGPDMDTGARCGYVVFAKGVGLQNGPQSAFVPGLLKRA